MNWGGGRVLGCVGSCLRRNDGNGAQSMTETGRRNDGKGAQSMTKGARAETGDIRGLVLARSVLPPT